MRNFNFLGARRAPNTVGLPSQARRISLSHIRNWGVRGHHFSMKQFLIHSDCIAYPYGNQSGQSGNTLSSPEKGFPDYPLVRRVENTSPEPFLHLLFFRCMVARLPLVRNWPWTSPGSPEPVRRGCGPAVRRPVRKAWFVQLALRKLLW